MFANVDLPTILSYHRQDHRPRPMTALVGRDNNGSFRTGKAKEYGPSLCRAMADALCRALPQPHAQAEWKHTEMVNEFIAESAIFSHSSWLPDYQPRDL